MGPQPLRGGSCMTDPFVAEIPHPLPKSISEHLSEVARSAYRSDIKWVSSLAASLELVLAANTFEEARVVARDALGNLVDPMDGIRDIPDELRLRWRIAARRKENHG